MQPNLPPHHPPSFLPQCYGLWDHEEDPVSKEPDGGHRKEKEPGEVSALLELQHEEVTGPQEELGVAGAPTKDAIPEDVRDGPPEPQVELKPRDTRRISLHFRRRRKESAEPRELAAVGTCPCQSRTTLAHPAVMPQSSHTLCPHAAAPTGPLLVTLGGPCAQSAGLKLGDGSPFGGSQDGQELSEAQPPVLFH